MWWVWVLVVIALLVAVWALTLLRSKWRARLPTDERSLANQAASAEAHERRWEHKHHKGYDPYFGGGRG